MRNALSQEELAALAQGDVRLLAMRRYGDAERGAAQVAAVGVPGVRMARIAVRPMWVGVLDFQTRFPGGTDSTEFDRRGRA